MRRNALLVATAMALATLTGAAWAQQGPNGIAGGPGMMPGGGPGMMPGPDQIFDRFDADGDGQVTQAEVDAFRDARFLEADADGDGAVSFAEMQAMMLARMEERMRSRFDAMDANGDGVIAKDEMMAGPPVDMFDRFDQNGDGVVTREEVDQTRPMRGGGGWGGGWRN